MKDFSIHLRQIELAEEDLAAAQDQLSQKWDELDAAHPFVDERLLTAERAAVAKAKVALEARKREAKRFLRRVTSRRTGTMVQLARPGQLVVAEAIIQRGGAHMGKWCVKLYG